MAFEQLVALGLSPQAVQRLVTSGRLHRIHRGVYAVGHVRLSRRGRRMAAVLFAGPYAVLSHRTAGGHWSFLRPPSGAIHVTAPARGRRRTDGIALHGVRDLDPVECTVHDGIPVTTVARTLLDLAASERPALVAIAVEEADRARLLDMRALDAVCQRPRAGVRALRAALAAYRPVPHWDRSRYERDVVRALREAGVPVPALNVWLHGYEVDLLWAAQRLVVELDGPRHESPAARQRDARRDAALQLHGYRVLRVPYHWWDADRAGVVRVIRGLVSAGEGTPALPGR